MRVQEGRTSGRRLLWRIFLGQLVLLCWLASCHGERAAEASMVDLSDMQLASITGQALLDADRITPGGTVPGVDSGLTFYSMGLDAQVAFNANISHLQLGCGGINNYIVTGCDVDMQYVSFMGMNNPAGASTSPGNAVTSDFLLTQPYVQLAIANDGTPNREVAGFLLGANSADGYISVGRVYTSNNQYNQEQGTSCTSNNPISCNSGINTVSGYLNTHFAGSAPLHLQNVCIGVVVFGACVGYNANETDTATFDTTLPIAATRVATVRASGVPLTIYGGAAGAIAGVVTPYADITESLRMIHGFSVVNSSGYPVTNFGISFQRQQIAYPTFEKTGYNTTANTGWWFNLPSVQITGINGATVTITSLGQLTSSLGSPGLSEQNINLNQQPTVNCYGSARFC